MKEHIIKNKVNFWLLNKSIIVYSTRIFSESEEFLGNNLSELPISTQSNRISFISVTCSLLILAALVKIISASSILPFAYNHGTDSDMILQRYNNSHLKMMVSFVKKTTKKEE